LCLIGRGDVTADCEPSTCPYDFAMNKPEITAEFRRGWEAAKQTAALSIVLPF